MSLEQKMKKQVKSSRRKLLATYRKELEAFAEKYREQETEREYRQWQHDQRMMWFRESDGTNQCIPAGGWAILLQRIAA